MLRLKLRTLHNHMDLREFTANLPHGGVTVMASAIGVTPVYLSQLAARQDGREPSPELCVRIEVYSGRMVRRWDMRPMDWHRIWPELIGTEGAPSIDTPAEAGM
jgi:DNA-binding transcriptional regulator YdaS (Cro superfamily)